MAKKVKKVVEEKTQTQPESVKPTECPNCHESNFLEIVKDQQFKCTGCGYVVTV